MGGLDENVIPFFDQVFCCIQEFGLCLKPERFGQGITSRSAVN